MKALSIGNFDGVHLGHRHLFQIAADVVGVSRLTAVTFEPLPLAILKPNVVTERLTPAPQRAHYLKSECRVSDVVELTPTRELLGRSPMEFMAALVAQCRFDVIVEGADFRFGRERAGSLDTLRELGAQHDFRVFEAPAFMVELTNGERVEARSSVARALLAQGRVHDAARVFGRPYELRCPTVRGDQRGRTIGWPTANLDSTGCMLPRDGVYAGSATLPDGRVALAAISVGNKPTFNGTTRVCETTLLAADGAPLGLPLDWYGFTLRLRFHEWIREQQKFASLAELLKEMELDRARVVKMRLE